MSSRWFKGAAAPKPFSDLAVKDRLVILNDVARKHVIGLCGKLFEEAESLGGADGDYIAMLHEAAVSIAFLELQLTIEIHGRERPGLAVEGTKILARRIMKFAKKAEDELATPQTGDSK